jgi:hydrogenase maturation protease
MGGRVLVIGYGNTLRGDDGVGQRVANRVMRWQRPKVIALAVVQLTPELAADLAHASEVVFIDAACGQDELRVTRVQPIAEPGSVGHAGSPGRLLGWTQALYGFTPEAWVVTIPAYDTEFGEGLSPGAARGMRTALRWLRDWLEAFDTARPGLRPRG